MAMLQCIQSVKNRTRAPLKSLLEAAQSKVVLPRKTRSGKQADNLYEIEVVAEDGPRIKVHYVGYGAVYDEWKHKNDIIINKPTFEIV